MINNKNSNFTVLSEKIFFKIFPRIKIQEDKRIETKDTFVEKISRHQFKICKKTQLGAKVLQKKFRFLKMIKDNIFKKIKMVKQFYCLKTK